MPVIELKKVLKAIELYKKQLEVLNISERFTKEFMEAAHEFNKLNKAEKEEMMRIMGFDETQIKEAMEKLP